MTKPLLITLTVCLLWWIAGPALDRAYHRLIPHAGQIQIDYSGIEDHDAAMDEAEGAQP